MTGELRISDIAKRFGSVKALQGVSLSVRSGEFVSFLGPSGCGKTTLLRIIAGFEAPDSGDVELDGASIVALPPYRRPIGMVFQNLALFPHLTVAGNVGFGLAVRRVSSTTARKKIADALALVGLQDFQDRRMHQLSGGQRQRVALARALVTDPAVLLLDEPLSALDLKLRRQLQSELKQLQHRTGTTFIFVTHDQEEAMAMSDRVAVFRNGLIEQVGPPEEIYRRPATRFVAEFVGETNILSGVREGDYVRLPDLDLKVRAPRHLAGAGRMTLSVRPESIELRTDQGSDALTVRIRQLEFGGMTLRFSAEAESSGHLIKVAIPSERAPGLKEGQSVRLGFDLAAAAALPEE